MVVSARFRSWIGPSMVAVRAGLRFLLPLQCLILLWSGLVRSNPNEDWVQSDLNWLSPAPASVPWAGEDFFILHDDGIISKLSTDNQVLWSFPTGPLVSYSSVAPMGLEGDANLSAPPPYPAPDPDEIEMVVAEDDLEVIVFSVKDQEFIVHAKGVDGKALATLNSKGRQLSPDEVLSRVPYRMDGTIVNGCRSSVVFAVNGSTGKLLGQWDSTPRLSKEPLSNLGNLVTEALASTEEASDEVTLYISRNEYAFQRKNVKTQALEWAISLARVKFLDENNSGGRHPPALNSPFTQVPPDGADEGASLLGRLPIANDNARHALALPPGHSKDPPMLFRSLSVPYNVLGLSILGLISLAIYWFLNFRAPRPREGTGNFPSKASKAGALMSPGSKGVKTDRRRKRAGRGKVESLGKQEEAPQKSRPSSYTQEDGGESGVGILGDDSSLSQEKVIAHGSKPGTDGSRPGTRVGKLWVTDKVIGYGSNGTQVLEGYLEDGRQVAVKKMLEHLLKNAAKEVSALIASDAHPNVVRYFFWERDRSFVYLALERCTCSLHDLILRASGGVEEDRDRLLPEIVVRKEDLWISDQEPSEKMMWLLRDVVAGLIHLHSKNIIHRDLKPHNVLVAMSGDHVKAKLCDMGISKRLDPDATSFVSLTEGGCGSRGWRAPEQLSHGEKQSPSVDLFNLGCLLFFCITGGGHPFGSDIHRESNIMNSSSNLLPLSDLPEAAHLIRPLLDKDPKARLEAKEVLAHPFFWNPEKCLNFLTATSDKFELEDRVKDSEMLKDLEAIAASAFKNQWSDKIDLALLSDATRFRQYKYRSVRDLLRFIRNRSHHYAELPPEVKALLEPYPDGYVRYFKKRFPNLLLDVYSVVTKHCKRDGAFRDFFTFPREWLS